MNKINTDKICPLCGCTYNQYPALSRTDNKTYICPDCGLRQSLIAAGLSSEVIEQIVHIQHLAANGCQKKL